MTRVPAVLLAPIVLVQGRRLRRSIPRMSPAVPRAGGSRVPGAIRLLVLGDSSAVGTGVEQMTDALAGQIAKRLPGPVAWRVVGENGLRSDEVLAGQLPAALADPHDLIVVLVGWNDALQMRSARAFGADLSALLKALRQRNPEARMVVVAAPRFGGFAVYPQPLRIVIGAHVAGLTRVGARVAAAQGAVFVPGFDGVHVASDGFHPDAEGYGELADTIVAALA
ncbi:MAG TPA: SGNH/GDSL hydrolase family protein [Pseudolysinimonas sp.]|nr:SGNH/GDSL hydrolase family protein [Pseudolysinimonas sp.]